MRTLNHQRGFTLIEVLVAVVVMTIGMLGVSILIIEGLRMNQSAIYRSTAVSLAADMAERLRAGGRADFAAAERAGWRQQVAAQLPDGATATIEVSPAAGGLPSRHFEIRLQWPAAGRPEKATYRLTGQIPSPKEPAP